MSFKSPEGYKSDKSIEETGGPFFWKGKIIKFLKNCGVDEKVIVAILCPKEDSKEKKDGPCPPLP